MALTNVQYDNIMRQYERTRNANRRKSAERKEEIYSRIPDYDDLENLAITLATECVKARLNKDSESFAQLSVRLSETKQKKTKLLLANGYPEDYLEPLYTCPDCKDTGYIISNDGTRAKCHCFRNQEISILYRQSNIQDLIANENFSTLSYRFYEGDDLKRFENAVEQCKKFVQNFEHTYQNLYFYGTVGTGKSFLSGCIANELLKQGKSVIYFSSSSLFDTLANYAFSSKDKNGARNPYEDISTCDLLIIDDLGTELTNEFVRTQFFSFLNDRHLGKKATIISTNINLEELRDRYSDRIFSRITSNYTLCKFTGPDIRILKKRLANTTAE